MEKKPTLAEMAKFFLKQAKVKQKKVRITAAYAHIKQAKAAG